MDFLAENDIFEASNLSESYTMELNFRGPSYTILSEYLHLGFACNCPTFHLWIFSSYS